MYQRLHQIFWSFVLGSVAVFFLMLGLAALGVFGKMPSFEELENPSSHLASEVYSADGVLLGTYYIENRSSITFDTIPQILRNCLIATEDIRFYRHSGIDYWGQFAALISTLMGDVRGGSTITQQLAKNLFPRPGDNLLATILSKFKEWVIAIKLERRYTKEEILSLYLQTVQFSENSYGIASAARTYFNKKPDSLKVEEAAVLIGMLKGSTFYNPKRNPSNALARRNIVLGQMAKYKYLPKEHLDSLRQLPIQLNYVSPDHNKGMATYFREYLRQQLLTWCKNHKKPDGTPYNLYKDGLRIYTTIDSRMQRYAEEAVRSHMKELQKQFYASYANSAPWGSNPKYIDEAMKQSERWIRMKRSGISEDSIWRAFHQPQPMTVFTYDGEKDTMLSPYDSIKYYKFFLHCGFMAMDPSTGHVKAWVGGIDHTYFQYDHVNVNTKRQVGSTIKPILYAVAIDNGYSPCYEFPNQRIVFPEYQNWSPENADGTYGGNMTLYEGLAKSVNTISAHLIRQLGPQPMIDLARRLGIESKMDPYPAISLGVSDISVFEMTGAYSAFANQGTYTRPQYLLRITDNRGVTLEEFTTRQVEAFSPDVAYVMVKMLQNVVDRGTAQRLRTRYGIKADVAGKTGTTQNNTDGWFVGFTPQIVAGCWVGGADRIIRFRSTFYGQGANMALPIFALFLKSCFADPLTQISPTSRFPEPPQPLAIETDCSVYKQHAGEQIHQILFGQ